MGLMDRIQGWLSEDRGELVYRKIDASRVDRSLNEGLAKADEHYFRLMLAQMFLRKKTKVLQEWYPAVHSVARFNFGGQRVEVPNIADSSRLLAAQDADGDVIARNFTLVPLTPFKGGEVTLTAGLFAVPGANRLKDFIGVMSGFAQMVAVPQLSAALSITTPLADGIQTLFGSGGGMHLGFQDTFVGDDGGGNPLEAQYIALVRAHENEVDQSRLIVVDDQLRKGSGVLDGEHEPFEDHDFMLLRIEILAERDDWNQLNSISEPFVKATHALKEQEEKKADAHFRQAVVTAFNAPELTKIDRRRVLDLLKADYAEAKERLLIGLEEALDLGPSRGGRRSRGTERPAGFDLGTRMSVAAMTIEEAKEKGAPTYDDLEG